MAGDKWFDDYTPAAGIPAGPKLKATIFVPQGVGIGWIDASGYVWQQVLVDNGDGTVDLKLQQVTF